MIKKSPKIPREKLDALARELTDQGKLIEAGWIGYRISVMHPDASEVQVDETRLAFFAGAQHLFGSIMSIMDAGSEPTDKDMERISLIDRELQNFVQQFQMRHTPTEGSA